MKEWEGYISIYKTFPLIRWQGEEDMFSAKICTEKAQQLIGQFEKNYADLFSFEKGEELFLPPAIEIDALDKLDSYYKKLEADAILPKDKQVIKVYALLRQKLFCLHVFSDLEKVTAEVNHKIFSLNQYAANYEEKLNKAKKDIELHIDGVHYITAFIINELRNKGYSSESAKQGNIDPSIQHSTQDIQNVLLGLPSIGNLNEKIEILIQACKDKNEEILQHILPEIMNAKTKMKNFSSALQTSLADSMQPIANSIEKPLSEIDVERFYNYLMYIFHLIHLLQDNDELINEARNLHKTEKENETPFFGSVVRAISGDFYPSTKNLAELMSSFAAAARLKFEGIAIMKDRKEALNAQYESFKEDFDVRQKRLTGKIEALQITTQAVSEKITPHMQILKSLKRIKILNARNFFMGNYNWLKILGCSLLGAAALATFAFTFPISGALCIAGVIIGGAIVGGAIGGGIGITQEIIKTPPVIKTLLPAPIPEGISKTSVNGVNNTKIRDPFIEPRVEGVGLSTSFSSSTNLFSPKSNEVDANLRGVSTDKLTSWFDLDAALNPGSTPVKW